MVERLAILSEECADVQQMIGKILRHGIMSYHPDDPSKATNQDVLANKLGDLLHAVGIVMDKDVNKRIVEVSVSTRDKTIQDYIHQTLPKNNYMKRLIHFRDSSENLNSTDFSTGKLADEIVQLLSVKKGEKEHYNKLIYNYLDKIMFKLQF